MKYLSVSKCGTSKLQPEDIIKIRRCVAEKEVSQYALAKRYGVSQAQISRIVNRLVWKELP